MRDDARDVRRVSFVGRFWGIETRRCGYFERWYLIDRHGGLSTCEYAQDASDFSLSRASRLRDVKWLKSLGAIEVFKDEGDLSAELEEKRLFAKPRLALDGVGGISAVRLAETLHQGCPLIVYACASGRAATFPWHHWVGKGLIVRGFSLRNWMKENKKKTPKMMETLAKLVNANKIVV